MRRWGIVACVLTAASLALAVPTVVGASGAGPAAAVAKPAAAPPAPNLALAHVKAVTIASGLTEPLAFAWRTGDLSRVYVAEQTGKVVIVANGKIVSTALTLTGLSSGNEEGLLGLVFSNDGTKLYVDYTDTTGDIHIVEYTMSGNVANPATRRQLLLIPHHTFPNHNGGNLVIGPDNMLYIGVGDGGGAGDTLHNAQNLGALLGKILRIDPHPHGSSPYTIPAGNPFVGRAGARPEIWMYGLRNPWRFSFDRTTHDLWIGDVGQNLYEEVDYAPAGQSGINWGWNLREGLHPYNGGAKPPGARDPILERPHTAGDCAIIGGYVYRGSLVANFNGAYVFGDECTGEVRAVVQKAGKVVQAKDLLVNIPQLTSFGQGPAGTIYAASRAGKLYALAQG
jgi:glucose/arabinose dehydrogenase